MTSLSAQRFDVETIDRRDVPLKEPPMTYYKASSSLTINWHLAFSVALDLQRFDPESASEAYSTQVEASDRCDGSQDFNFCIKRALIPMGLVANDGPSLYVTPHGRVWGDVCRLQPDGTILVFAKVPSNLLG